VVVPWRLRVQRPVQLADELAHVGIAHPAQAQLAPQCRERRCTAVGLDITEAVDRQPPDLARLIEVAVQGMGEREPRSFDGRAALVGVLRVAQGGSAMKQPEAIAKPDSSPASLALRPGGLRKADQPRASQCVNVTRRQVVHPIRVIVVRPAPVELLVRKVTADGERTRVADSAVSEGGPARHRRADAGGCGSGRPHSGLG
jgi:hypothetical protein